MQLEVEIPVLVVLIGLSGFFSGLEVALVGTRMSKIEQMVKDKVKGSASLLKLKKNPSRMMASVCLLYTSPSPRDLSTSRMPSSA